MQPEMHAMLRSTDLVGADTSRSRLLKHATKAWNEYQACFPDLTVRHTIASGAARASHRHKVMDSVNFVPALTAWAKISTKNFQEDGRPKRVPVAEGREESCMARLLRMLFFLLIFYAGIRLFCRLG